MFTVYTMQVLKFRYPPHRIIAKTWVQEKSVNGLSFWNCKIKIFLQYWMWYIPHKNPCVSMKCNYRNVQSIFVAWLAPVRGVSSWPVHFLHFPHQNPVYIHCHSHACYMPSPSHQPCYDHPNNIWWGVLTMKLLIMQSSPLSLLSSTWTQISSITPCSWTPSVSVLPWIWETKFHTYTKNNGPN